MIISIPISPAMSYCIRAASSANPKNFSPRCISCRLCLAFRGYKVRLKTNDLSLLKNTRDLRQETSQNEQDLFSRSCALLFPRKENRAKYILRKLSVENIDVASKFAKGDLFQSTHGLSWKYSYMLTERSIRVIAASFKVQLRICSVLFGCNDCQALNIYWLRGILFCFLVALQAIFKL